MTEREQIQAYADEIDKVTTRFCHEFDLSNASAVGVLMIKAHNMIADSKADQAGGGEDDKEESWKA